MVRFPFCCSAIFRFNTFRISAGDRRQAEIWVLSEPAYDLSRTTTGGLGSIRSFGVSWNFS
jgi:hypothetical protein